MLNYFLELVSFVFTGFFGGTSDCLKGRGKGGEGGDLVTLVGAVVVIVLLEEEPSLFSFLLVNALIEKGLKSLTAKEKRCQSQYK